MRVITCLMVLSLASLSVSAAVYRWMDEGSPVYTDQVVPGAEELYISGSQPRTTGEAGAPAAAAPGQPASTEPIVADVYSRIEITQPGKGAAISNPDGAVTVELTLEPVLQAGHQVFLQLDGDSLPPQRSTRLTLSRVSAGRHLLSALVRNAEGGLLGRADTVSFDMKLEAASGPGVTSSP
jgi:hypothetical protein